MLAHEQYFSVIYEDNHLIVVNKKAGLLVQGDESGDLCLVDVVKDYLKHKYEKQSAVFCGLPHRLDRPVSGLVVMTKTSRALERMNKIFSTRSVKKTYWAIVGRKPEPMSGHLRHWLVKDRNRNTVSYAEKEVPNSQLAELDYQLIKPLNPHYLIEVNPITGRPHQIRVQLSALDCSILGDLKYGYPKANADMSIALHARRIEFLHPVRKQNVVFEANVPNSEVWASVRRLMPKAVAPPPPLLAEN